MEIIFALSSFSSSSWLQCDQIGRFLNVFGDKVSFKTDPFQTNFKTSIFKLKLPRLLYGQLFILASGHSAPELLSFASYLIIHIFFVRGSISVGTVDLLFDWFGFGQTGKSDNNLNVKSCWIQQAVKQYFSFTSILSISRYVNILWSNGSFFLEVKRFPSLGIKPEVATIINAIEAVALSYPSWWNSFALDWNESKQPNAKINKC